MLRRQRQVRTQIQKFVDASLFAFGFWLAHTLRSHWELQVFGGEPKIQPFDDYFWYFLLTIPLGLVLLSLQGFYDRPLIASRRQTWWQLAKVCTFAVIGIILVMFIRRELFSFSRSVIILFGGISF